MPPASPPHGPSRPWLDRLVEPSFALRGVAVVLVLLELRAALAALTGAAAEPFDGLINQLWQLAGGQARDRAPLLMSLALMLPTGWGLWRLARQPFLDTPPRHVWAWLLALDLLAFAVTPALAFLVTVLAGLMLSARGALAFAALQVLLALALYAFLPTEAQRLEQAQGAMPALLTQGLWMVALYGLGFGLGRLTAAQADKRRWLQAVLAERLSAEQLHDEQLRYSERLGLARELHDLMGHHLTALNLQLQLGEALLARHQGTEAAAALGKARGVAEQLLADVRQAVSLQREHARIDLSAALQALAQGIESPRIALDLDPEAVRNLGPRSAHALLRCVQEAVTNAVRHARARHLAIQVRAEGPTVCIRIEDDGQGQGKLKAGNGLTGMRERLAELGGRLDILRQQPGFLIELRCPRDPETPA
ncbi:MAG: sensor histidine kinase [Inhella sp.]|uniref:sensor histidine kinase n=1 Tax=Inhella sp. TaxID=1921806 RepID=UPI0022C069B3|nr:histidine kinase [Inhella sp.]MCZ8234074.1 histidine kinase [Inhella sp.]